jgi:hypothetical protein
MNHRNMVTRVSQRLLPEPGVSIVQSPLSQSPQVIFRHLLGCAISRTSTDVDFQSPFNRLNVKGSQTLIVIIYS